MATARTIYQDGRDADGAAPAGHTFVWVSLRDPRPEELASVQHEFGLPGPLVDDPDTPGPPVGRRHRGNGDPDRWHALQAAESGRTRRPPGPV
jgi:hypothetical protein